RSVVLPHDHRPGRRLDRLRRKHRPVFLTIRNSPREERERTMPEYKAVTVSKGRGGWGGPLVIKPTDDKPLIYSVTGGGIHPVAQRIADLTGGQPFDGFKGSAPFDKIAVAVIDCGGTARIGVYPMKKV